MAKKRLYELTHHWQESVRDDRDACPFVALLNEFSFQADLRYADYVQYRQDGAFLTRLEKWLSNVSSIRHQQALFQLLAHLIFIDALQMTSLYRDAYRRIIGPWLDEGSASIDSLLLPDFADRKRRLLAEYQIASITESFDVNLLLHANDLHGLPRPFVLGPTEKSAGRALQGLAGEVRGFIVGEDIVGTGRQAGTILRTLERRTPRDCRLLFVPLIAFEDGLDNIESNYVSRTVIRPVVVLPRRSCLRKEPACNEPQTFKVVRGIVSNTSKRVLEPLDKLDDPPTDPFGYQGTGGLIVTCHNAPNNTLPLIHHQAPNWKALFRRLHHKERGS